ncbi:hypothetical protein [Hymenobacter cellulosivorans]|uniref:Uncharacterized protein n=1 Tax=Hymenobacter cellulosivorans TaxID=2932249 RepID=A0ABY4F4R5_9BACT|nr:hypothetical protein [Hymenobacter cellulosivorans]UOQ51454.1 hypothetical protein MUN80_16990 [Hymenobacter cellulosivorans]
MNEPQPTGSQMPAQPTPPEIMEESVFSLLHAFDPATALHELDLLDEPDQTPLATAAPNGQNE